MHKLRHIKANIPSIICTNGILGISFHGQSTLLIFSNSKVLKIHQYLKQFVSTH